jgi:adenosylcobinamide-GDP ribazoletransferase
VALSLFTVIPAGVRGVIRRDSAAKALPWLPAVGALLAALASGAMLAVQAGGHSDARRLLGAALAIAVLGLLTGGLHLDGLADTADGLGSRRPSREALAIAPALPSATVFDEPIGMRELLSHCTIL